MALGQSGWARGGSAGCCARVTNSQISLNVHKVAKQCAVLRFTIYGILSVSETPAKYIIKGCEESQGKLLEPKLDIVFKKLFCMPDNVQALLRFINLIFVDRW